MTDDSQHDRGTASQTSELAELKQYIDQRFEQWQTRHDRQLYSFLEDLGLDREMVDSRVRQLTDMGLSRRRALELTAAAAVGMVSGAGGMAALTEPAAASNHNDNDPNLGGSSDRWDVWADLVDANTVNTEDIPHESWEKWATRNGVQSNGLPWSIIWPRANLNRAATGDGSTSQITRYVNVDTGSGSGSGSTASVEARLSGSALPWEVGFDQAIVFETGVRIADNVSNLIAYHSLSSYSTLKNGSQGFGFKIASGELQGVVHDGSSETTTTLLGSTNFSQGDNMAWRAELDPTDGVVDFYVNDTHEGAISSGLPTETAITPNMSYSVENTADESNKHYLAHTKLAVIA